MYPQFSDYVTRGDTIYALPIESWRYWNAVNPSLARRFGLNDKPDILEGYLNNAMAWYTSYDYPQHAQHYSFNGGKDFEAVRWQLFSIMLRSYIPCLVHRQDGRGRLYLRHAGVPRAGQLAEGFQRAEIARNPPLIPHMPSTEPTMPFISPIPPNIIWRRKRSRSFSVM